MKVVALSPKGQITVPKEYRNKLPVKHYLFQLNGADIVLSPVKLEVIRKKKSKTKTDELKDFGRLAESSFAFWNNEEDDIYEKFYK